MTEPSGEEHRLTPDSILQLLWHNASIFDLHWQSISYVRGSDLSRNSLFLLWRITSTAVRIKCSSLRALSSTLPPAKAKPMASCWKKKSRYKRVKDVLICNNSIQKQNMSWKLRLRCQILSLAESKSELQSKSLSCGFKNNYMQNLVGRNVPFITEKVEEKRGIRSEYLAYQLHCPNKNRSKMSSLTQIFLLST